MFFSSPTSNPTSFRSSPMATGKAKQPTCTVFFSLILGNNTLPKLPNPVAGTTALVKSLNSQLQQVQEAFPSLPLSYLG